MTFNRFRMKTPVLIFGIISFLFFLAGCDLPYYFSGPVGKAIRKEVRKKSQTAVKLKEVVPFEWEELYLFNPYTPRSEICRKLGIPDSKCRDTIPEESMDDGEMYLVFLKSGKIVHREMYDRFNGDFTPLDFIQPVTPGKSVFRVKADGVSREGKPWLRLRPQYQKPL